MTLAKKGLGNIVPAIRYYKKQIIFIVLALAILFGMTAFCAPDYRTVKNMNGMTSSMLQKVDELFSMESAEKVGKLTAVSFKDGTLIIGGKTLEGAKLLTYLTKNIIWSKKLCQQDVFPFMYY